MKMIIDGQTVSGVEYCFDDITPGQIRITDIAHGLANICRYNGQVKEFFSVAQHSILVSKLVEPELALWGLLHDASEAYMGDLTAPFKTKKKYEAIGERYKKIEERIMLVISEHFNLKPKFIPNRVKRFDVLVRYAETQSLFEQGKIVDLTEVTEGLGIGKIFPLDPKKAKKAFLDRFLEIIDNDQKEDQTSYVGGDYKRE